eukprot:CAMPEP_0172194132 /NCGR_PEP_ID=MMETSP1050-20130122/25386_1 /TAXON_ID=233186 /ORGANISM="Cryptomonas curvata, Strain CCAP979/52" /LENGTH=161 /DNA_ID=CAMNT_0012869857 /DNA_START=45 /DNA_END=527 /DNA_ORIENTATION=+
MFGASQLDQVKAMPSSSNLLVGMTSGLELVGTIDARRQTRSSMSWSTHDKYLAMSTGDNVSVWRLPGRSQLKRGRRNNYDDTLSMPEDDNMTKAVTPPMSSLLPSQGPSAPQAPGEGAGAGAMAGLSLRGQVAAAVAQPEQPQKLPETRCKVFTFRPTAEA